MADTSLTKKLLLKPGYRMLLLNAPEGYAQRLEPLPEGATLHTTPDGAYDWVQLFVFSKADADRHTPTAIKAVKPGGLLWMTYPKKTSTIKTDINRDSGWDAINKAGWLGVTQIAIDDTWSALRFRPESEIKTITRKRE